MPVKNIHLFIIHIANNLFPLNEYSSGEIKNLMDKFKEEADDLNINIDDAKLESYIQRFDQLKNSPKIQEKDLRKYSLSKLIKLVTSSEGVDDDREDTTPDVVYDDENITIWNGSKENNCVLYGRGEKWCITRGSFDNYRYSQDRSYPTFYLAKNGALPDDDKLSFVAIQVRDNSDENKKYVYTNRQNSPHESQPMSFSTLMNEVSWLREVPNIKNVLKYIPLSSSEKATQVYGKSGGELSIRRWVELPFPTKKQYLVARKDKNALFSDISNDEFVSQYLPQYPQLTTFIAVTPRVLDSILLLKHLDKFSNNDRKSITANLHDNIELEELSKENISFPVKKLLVALNKWDLKSNERLYTTKDGNAIVKLTFGDDVKAGVYTAEDDYPNIKLNARTSKYLTEYPELDKIPFNNLLKLASNDVVSKEFINTVLTKAQEDPNSAVIVKDIDNGKLILDSNSFTSYKLEDGKISQVPFDSEEVQNILTGEEENSGFQESAINTVFSDKNQLPQQIDKDSFYKILNNTPYANRTRDGEVILVNPENNKIFSISINPVTDLVTRLMYGGLTTNDWRERVDSRRRALNANEWRIYFDYLRNQNRSYTSEQLIELIDNNREQSKKDIIDANPPMADNSRIRPAVIDGKYVLINTQDPRNSQTLGRRGNLIRASIPPNVAARALGGQAAAEPAAAPVAGGRGRPAGARAAAPTAPAAPVAAGEANANTIASIEEAGLRAGFTMLPPNIRTRITAGTVVPYTRRNAALDAVGRVTTLISSGSCKFYIIRLPSGTIIGFATQNLPLPIYHAIVTTNRAYRVPRVGEFANTIQQNGINESLKTLIRLHSVAIPEEAKQMREILLKLKNKKK